MTAPMVQDSGAHPKQLPPQHHQPIKSANQSFLFSSPSMRILSEPHDVYRISSSHKSNVSSSAIMLTNSIPTSSTSQTFSQLPSQTATDKTTTSRIGNISQCLSETAKERIATILHDVENLNDVEKLYLYLQLPEGTTGSASSAGGDNKKKVNYPFGKKTDTEVVQAYTWIQSHLQEDSDVSTPKHEVYQDYKDYCEQNNFEKLCVADFGKAMRQMFPNVKPRRLGQRGNSKYCYSGLRKRLLVECPELPILDTSEQQQRTVGAGNGSDSSARSLLSETTAFNDASVGSPWSVILQWVELQYKRKFTNTADCTRFLDEQEVQGRMSGNRAAPLNFVPSKTSPAIRKKEMTNQLSKKMQEKKKCDLMNGGTPALSKGIAGSSSAAINHSSGQQHQKSTCNFPLIATNNSSAFINGSLVKIKSEPTDDRFNCNTKALYNNCNKMGNSPPSTLVQLSPNQTSLAATTTPGPLPKVNSLYNCLTKSPQMSATTQNQTISGVCTNGFQKMYKTIQPKPGSFDFSQLLVKTEDGTVLNLQQAFNAEKRRHSVATPFSLEAALSESKCLNDEAQLLGFGSELKLVPADSDKNFKRSIEERDVHFMAKKRHVSERAISNNGNIVNSAENSDLRVNELEHEALLDDYLDTTNNNASTSYVGVNGGTPQQQLSPALANSDNNNKDFTQIRKYLESNLPPFNHQHGGVKGVSAAINGSNSNAGYNTLDHSNSNSNMSLTPNTFHFTNGRGGGSASALDEMANCTLNSRPSHHSVPPSPTSRRLQFNFQPISPRDTPTIPENAALELNMLKQGSFNGGNAAAGGGGGNPFAPQMNSVAVGTSQPPSENNSPFISPRNTPNPLSRSRNNSGQSSYSSNQFRQTPMLSGGSVGSSGTSGSNNFDSGVSSISSSPFISPLSTPVPCNARIMNRLESSNNSLRVRHSSGPGGPINRPVSNVMAYHRSNSLSPMISDGNYFFANNNNNSPSYQLNSLNTDLMTTATANNKCNSVTQTDHKASLDASNMLPSFNSTLDNYSFSAKSQLRQRHFSNPYAVNSNSALMKPEPPGNNSTITSGTNDESIKMLLNRSQSVPLSQMFQGSSFDSISSLEPQYDSFGQLSGTATTVTTACSSNSSTGLSDLEQPSPVSKSYPSTPLCGGNLNESFTLPHSSAVGTATSTTVNSSSNSLEGSGGVNAGGGGSSFFSGVNIDELLTNDNDPLIQSGEDLLVSSAQLNSCISEGGVVSTGSVNDELNVPSSPLTMSKAGRDDYNDLLNEGLDQFTDGFSNCDTDFNLGLDSQANTYDDVFSEYNNYTTTRALCTYQKPDVCFL